MKFWVMPLIFALTFWHLSLTGYSFIALPYFSYSITFFLGYSDKYLGFKIATRIGHTRLIIIVMTFYPWPFPTQKGIWTFMHKKSKPFTNEYAQKVEKCFLSIHILTLSERGLLSMYLCEREYMLTRERAFNCSGTKSLLLVRVNFLLPTLLALPDHFLFVYGLTFGFEDYWFGNSIELFDWLIYLNEHVSSAISAQIKLPEVKLIFIFV